MAIRRNFEERLHHRHIQRFAEPTWAAELYHLIPAVENAHDELGLVYQHRISCSRIEPIISDGQHFAAAVIDDARMRRAPYAVAGLA